MSSSEQLVVGGHMGSHDRMGEADRLHRWERSQRVCVSLRHIIDTGSPTATRGRSQGDVA
ncbi:hypothetical protein [Streptomyces erythrochromogenes]|uniref:hypothetical protein n=1 Tax=Streptomyces erythrochromogenes TaxID=285574 RepID=UPI0036C43DB9